MDKSFSLSVIVNEAIGNYRKERYLKEKTPKSRRLTVLKYIDN